jgi:hypothetical protein
MEYILLFLDSLKEQIYVKRQSAVETITKHSSPPLFSKNLRDGPGEM